MSCKPCCCRKPKQKWWCLTPEEVLKKGNNSMRANLNLHMTLLDDKTPSASDNMYHYVNFFPTRDVIYPQKPSGDVFNVNSDTSRLPSPFPKGMYNPRPISFESSRGQQTRRYTNKSTFVEAEFNKKIAFQQTSDAYCPARRSHSIRPPKITSEGSYSKMTPFTSSSSYASKQQEILCDSCARISSGKPSAISSKQEILCDSCSSAQMNAKEETIGDSCPNIMFSKKTSQYSVPRSQEILCDSCAQMSLKNPSESPTSRSMIQENMLSDSRARMKHSESSFPRSVRLENIICDSCGRNMPSRNPSEHSFPRRYSREVICDSCAHPSLKKSSESSTPQTLIIGCNMQPSESFLPRRKSHEIYCDSCVRMNTDNILCDSCAHNNNIYVCQTCSRLSSDPSGIISRRNACSECRRNKSVSFRCCDCDGSNQYLSDQCCNCKSSNT